MYDRPTAEELIAAVREHLESAVLPTITDQRLRFQTLVAAHVLGIVERELDLSAAHRQAAWSRLDKLLQEPQPQPPRDADQAAALAERNRQMCALIQQGTFDAEPQNSALWQHLYQTALEKLAVANPKFVARVQREDHA